MQFCNGHRCGIVARLFPLRSGGFRVSPRRSKVPKFLPRFSPKPQRVSFISVSAVLYSRYVILRIRDVRQYTCRPELAVEPRENIPYHSLDALDALDGLDELHAPVHFISPLGSGSYYSIVAWYCSVSLALETIGLLWQTTTKNIFERRRLYQQMGNLGDIISNVPLATP